MHIVTLISDYDASMYTNLTTIEELGIIIIMRIIHSFSIKLTFHDGSIIWHQITFTYMCTNVFIPMLQFVHSWRIFIKVLHWIIRLQLFRCAQNCILSRTCLCVPIQCVALCVELNNTWRALIVFVWIMKHATQAGDQWLWQATLENLADQRTILEILQIVIGESYPQYRTGYDSFFLILVVF